MGRGPDMELDGIHHVTAITADAQRNLDFYAGLLGLRFVKKTVNFDLPEVYHLYFGDERGSPGSILTFFEVPGAAPGRAGPGMIHSIVWRVRSAASLEFWAHRLSSAGVETRRVGDDLVFTDPEGLGLALSIDVSGDPDLTWTAPDIPKEHVILGFEGVGAYATDPGASQEALSEILGFIGMGARSYRVQGATRMAVYEYDLAEGAEAVQGAGTVHHIAWAGKNNDQELWRARIENAGLSVTPIIDRKYFRSIYFREPSGVLFEIATVGPGFTVDEAIETLGEELQLPGHLESLRDELQRNLTPLESPHRADQAAG